MTAEECMSEGASKPPQASTPEQGCRSSSTEELLQGELVT